MGGVSGANLGNPGVHRTNGKLFWNNEAEGKTLDITFGGGEIDTFKPVIGDTDVLNNGGINNNIIENGALAKMTIQRAGIYIIGGSYSTSGDITNTVIHVAAFRNTINIETGQVERLLATVFDVGAIATFDSVLCAAGDVLEVEMKVSKAITISFEHLTWVII